MCIMTTIKWKGHPKIKICWKCTHPQASQEFVSSSITDLQKCSITSFAQQWMGAVRMRVQTADKKIHNNPHHFSLSMNILWSDKYNILLLWPKKCFLTNMQLFTFWCTQRGEPRTTETRINSNEQSLIQTSKARHTGTPGVTSKPDNTN